MTVPTYLWPSRPLPVRRSALAWWVAVVAWFAGSSAGQLWGSPAAVALTYGDYERLGGWSVPGLVAVVVIGVPAAFWASLVLPMRDGARWARAALTVLAAPGAVVLLWQLGRVLFVGPATDGGVAQGLCCLVALCALAGAVGLMYHRSARSHFHPAPPLARRPIPWHPVG